MFDFWFRFSPSLLQNLFVIDLEMTLLHVGAHLVFYPPYSVNLEDFCQIPLRAGVFPGSRKG